jgi:hypothetical protein
MQMRGTITGLAIATLAACSGGGSRVGFVEGAINAEDLVPLPGGKFIVASGLDDPGKQAGRLTLIDIGKKSARLLFSGDSPVSSDRREGDPKCPGPLQPGKFGAHGLGLRLTGPTSGTLYVVNHTGREAVELFALDWSGQGTPIAWTGCIPLPRGVLSNGVTPLPGSRIAVTWMNAPEFFGGKPSGRENANVWIPKFIAGETTGYAATWGPGEGWRKVAGSEGSVPNGIEVSTTGRFIYVNLWRNSELRRVSLVDGAVLDVKLPFMPDNVHWGDDGKLWVAGAVGTARDYFACAAKKGCHNDWRLASIDPETMKAEVVEHPDTRPLFGDATAAVRVDGEVWIGSNPTDKVAWLSVAK